MRNIFGIVYDIDMASEGRAGRRTTLRTVAERAGVSPATVSKVIHGRLDIADGTRDRVRQALRDLNYVPVGRPPTPENITILAAFHGFGSVYSGDVLSGFIEHACDVGARVVVDLLPEPQGSRHSEDWVLRHASAGIRGIALVTAPIHHDLVHAAARHGIALVAVDPKTEVAPTIATIGASNWAGTSNATQHLIALGHRRIAFAGMDLSADFAAERFAGFRSSLERAEIALNAEYIGYGSTEFEHGQRIGARLASLPVPPTGVVAVCDAVALGVIEGARNKGLTTPEDLSVVGFDDVQPARWSTPLLTTVRQPLTAMGALAARTLTDLIAGISPLTAHMQLATELIVRDSTRAVAEP